MTYFVLRPLAKPHQQFGKLTDWENIVPDMRRRADINSIWLYGRALLNPLEMPKEIVLKGKARLLPTIFSSWSSINICKQELKSILEELDAGIHQFIPITVSFDSGETPKGSFFILNVHHILDTIIDEKSKADIGPLMSISSIRHYRLVSGFATKDGDIALSKSKLSSINLWRELAYPGLYMMSDKLRQKLKQENLNFFEPHKATEI